MLLTLSACYTIPAPAPVPSQSLPAGKQLYFPETGHNVGEAFLDFYRSENHSALLGYPITESTMVNGWQTQYFQFGQLELHPENEPAYFITVGWSGLLNNNSIPPQNGHPFKIADTFADFYNTNGGSVQFGKAISAPFIDKGLLVQDFQSARLIWTPTSKQSASVKLAPLSETYLLKNNLASLLDSVPPANDATIVTFSTIPVPDDAEISLVVEATDNENYSRVIAHLSENDTPLVGYATRLQWGTHSFNLPPTNYAGETHLLLHQTFSPETPLSLFDSEKLLFSKK